MDPQSTGYLGKWRCGCLEVVDQGGLEHPDEGATMPSERAGLSVLIDKQITPEKFQLIKDEVKNEGTLFTLT
jgi:hypothetical protein